MSGVAGAKVAHLLSALDSLRFDVRKKGVIDLSNVGDD